MKHLVRIIPVFFFCAAAATALFSIQAPRALAQTATTTDDRAKLQQEYDQLQQEISQWQNVLDQTRQKKASLQGDVTQLNAQIAQAQAQIKQRNVVISQLTSQISDKTATIQDLQDKINQGQDSLAKLLREKSQDETQSLAILALSSDTLSSFFSDVQAIDAINAQMQKLFADLQANKDQVQSQKDQLSQQQNQELDAKHEIEVQKTQVTQAEQAKQQLLTATAQNEQTYAQVLAGRQKKAEAIRTALFNLRDAQGISFEQALEYANTASQKTGVRAALILAILSQESDLGKNIGSCYVSDLASGNGVGKNTGTPYQKVMKAPRDTVPFQQITTAVGLDWSTTPVSCPLGYTYSASRGYGGAMGPSQFIPSTWLLFAPRIQSALGIATANPWNPQDGVMATALYLSDLGASAQTYTAERNAACKYYSGRSCDSRYPANTPYGNSVIAKADTFQQNIDFLKSL